ncbi:uncharacterized protein LOC143445483 isoform X2 [Clavelina lepadiformis]|uniref:uncharacterized protein LOC143445483 isoform X2 n=1 Tax=Clavelina lepadiformis TaxID=159417 RepID=UPI004042412A
MKTLKSHSSLHGHVVSSHLPAGKDRALANALLRMSERTTIQERNKTDDVIYCGDNEPMYGWTNAVPNPKYSDGNRPKKIVVKKKKLAKKIQIDLERAEQLDELTLSLNNVSTNVDGQYHTYATLRDMYDNYKKNMQLRSFSKNKEIIDPVTFKYIPWDERKEGNSGEIKLPTLKMAHATQPSKLIEVLEKYMKKQKQPKRRGNRVSDSNSSSEDSEAAEYSDKYKWNFKKDKSKDKIAQRRVAAKRKKEHIHLPAITTRGDNVEPNVKERLIRYVNGAVHNKRKNNTIYNNGRNVFYINVRGGDSNSNGPETIKLERKRDMGPNGGDRWVARVIIKEPEEPAPNGSCKNDTESSSSVIIVPDDRWKRNQGGVVAGERERIHREIENTHRRQKQEEGLKQLRRRLFQHTVHEANSFRDKYRRQPSFPMPPSYSLVETAKVSVKYNVETAKKKGIVRAANQEEALIAYSKPGVTSHKKTDRRISDPHANRNLTIGSDHVTRILPPVGKKSDHVSRKEEKEHSKPGRLILTRNTDQRDEKRKTSRKQIRVKLPVLPKQIERPEPLQTPDTSGDEDSPRRMEDKAMQNEDDGNNKDEPTVLPQVQGASTTFYAALGNNEVDRAQSPSSTFGSDVKLKQIVDSAQTLSHSHFSRDAQFLRYKVIPQPGAKSSNVPDVHDRKPIHPPHNRNRGQKRIQDWIDHEKGFVNSVAHHLHSSWMYGDKAYVQEQLGHSDGVKAALAKSKLLEENKNNQVPAKLATNGGGATNIIMKRRVVPPIIPTTSPTAAKQPDRDPQLDIPVVSSGAARKFDDSSSKDVASTTRKPKTNKKRQVKMTNRHAQERAMRRHELDFIDPNFDDVICSGDVIVRQRPTPKLLEHSFAASITSVKPSRRIVNIAPTSLAQQG